MRDFSLCQGKDCPIRKDCYRFMCPRSPNDNNWFIDPGPVKDFDCEYFWPIKRGKTLRALTKEEEEEETQEENG